MPPHTCMNYYFFSLNISYQTFVAHYSGVASSVVVITEQGLRLQLPATRLRPFLSQIGVKGRFRLTTDQNNRFVKLEVL
ncbi:DUF2835 domain-containing protein [Vibrio metoecus]|uniref:DUF2835 domain-containing protein n=2 Tax=Vibrio metoecus TaxID=1481663 RepID=A0A271VTH4_VIBMT|nr:DUF2835 domain-containing protein [Vibrio metoecus]PAR25998.1 DUF2835 domain-containing protein [Vibrio metoecus]PAR27642.1 DUF2835 domain-containing protein [Vibrio metoecus]PAR60100.1 DUF2835 domain-containing protein [Vibrio metoecus]